MKNYFKILLVAIIAMAMNENVFGQNQCQVVCSAAAGNDQTICCPGPGSCATIGATCSGCSGKTYAWSPGGATTCQVSVCPTVTTTYTLTTTFPCSSCCCDGCSGTTCGTNTANPCNGTAQTRQDQVTVFVNSTCCRLINPNTLQPVGNGEIKLFPNPSTGKVSIEFSKLNSATCVHIYDATGKVVVQDDNIDASKNTFEYDLSTSSKGIYFVQVVEGENVIYFEKLIYQ